MATCIGFEVAITSSNVFTDHQISAIPAMATISAIERLSLIAYCLLLAVRSTASSANIKEFARSCLIALKSRRRASPSSSPA